MQALAHLIPDARELQQQCIRWVPGLVLMWLVLFTFVQPQLPVDDALRHIVSYAWGYSHVAMYPLSTQTPYSQYPLFDWAAGQLCQVLGAVPTLKLMQPAAALLVGSAVYRAFHSALAGSSEERRLDAVILTVCLLWAALYARILLARPEVFVLGWAAWGLSLRGSWRAAGFWAWLVAGLLASSSYWLAWLAWPMVLVAPWSKRHKLFALATLSTYHLAFWCIWTDGAYLGVLGLLSSWNQARLVTVGEGKTALHLLQSPGALALIALGGFGWGGQSRAKRVQQAAALVPYVLLDMVRYGSTMLLLAHTSIATGFQRLNLGAGARLAVLSILTAATMASIKVESLPQFELPKGSRVLTPFGPATFAVPMTNPGSVETLPAMEVGASSQAVQAGVRALQRGDLDCRVLLALRVTHVVESSLRGQPPACLKLEQVQGAWRLWSAR